MAPRSKKSAAAAVAPESLVGVVVPPVTEDELRAISKLRKDIADLRSTLNASQKTLDIKEAAIIKRLRGDSTAGVPGAKVQGKLVAIVEMVKGRCTVSWKDVAMKLAVRLGLNPAQVELDEKKAKEATLVPEPTLLISGDAVEQYVGTEVGK